MMHAKFQYHRTLILEKIFKGFTIDGHGGHLGHVTNTFLAHLSLRLTGELIGYPWIRRPSVHIFKHLLL